MIVSPQAENVNREAKKMIINENYTLSNGVLIPKLGLGTWMLNDEQAKSAVINAVNAGYTLIDTAQAYENEAGVGEGIKQSGAHRETLFITSKIRAEHKSYKSAAESIDETLEKMQLDYIDMMIIHSPQPWNEFRGEKRYFEENREVWRALEDAYDKGKVKAIGVSNFLKDDMDNILFSCEIRPMVNQILTHISNTPIDLIDYCKKHGIHCEAYSPIAHGEAMKNSLIVATAKKYNITPAQLCIRYVIQLGMTALPKATSLEHIKANADIDFVISDEDMEILKNAEKIKDYGEFTFFPVFSGK